MAITTTFEQFPADGDGYIQDAARYNEGVRILKDLLLDVLRERKQVGGQTTACVEDTPSCEARRE